MGLLDILKKQTSESVRVFDDLASDMYPGANGWEFDAVLGCDNYPPVVRNYEEFEVVADETGSYVNLDEGNWYVLEFAIPSQQVAIAFLKGLPEDFDPKSFGYKLEAF